MKGMQIRAILITFLLLVSIHELRGQEVGSEAIGIQSPTAASLGTFGDTPVNFYTGQANVSVPLFTVSSRDLSVPIALRYQSGGVQVEETPGWAGMNWTLESGGIITRTLRGLPDDASKGYLDTKDDLEAVWDELEDYENGTNGVSLFEPDTTQWPQALYDYVVQGIELRDVDPEPDQFFFNFGGRSGQLVLSDASTVYTIPNSRLKVSFTRGTVGDPNNTASLANAIREITIVTEDGTKYIFGADQEDHDSREFTYFTGSGSTELAYVSGWYLQKIVSARGADTITFTYDRNEPSPNDFELTHFMKDSHEEYIPIGSGCIAQNPIQSSPDDNFQQLSTSFLTEIETGNGFKAVFTSNLRTGYMEPEYRKLDKIEWKGPTDSTIHAFDFTYENETAFGKRLLLRSVQESGSDGESLIPAYKFTYYGDDASDNVPDLPDRFSNDIDFRGYFNDAGNLSEDLTTVIYENGSNLDVFFRGSKEPNETAMLTGALKDITYPAGGKTSLEYEGHQYGRIAEPSSNLQFLQVSGTYEVNSVYAESIGNPTSTETFVVGGTGTATVNLQITFNPESGARFETVDPQNGMTAEVSLEDSNSMVEYQQTFTYNCSSNCDPYEEQVVTVALSLPPDTYTLETSAQDNASGETAIVAQLSIVQEVAASERLAGGLRIKKITQQPEIGPNVVQRFTYVREDTSSGVLIGEPKTYYKRIASGTCTELFSSTQAQGMLGVGKEIGYSQVAVYYEDDNPDGSPNDDSGYSVYTFYAADEAQYQDDPIIDVGGGGYVQHLWPFGRLTSLAYKRGSPIAVRHYDDAGVEISREGYTYYDSYYDDFLANGQTADTLQTRLVPALAFKRDNQGQSDLAFYMKRYNVLSAWQYQGTDTSFVTDGSSGLTKMLTRNYAYDESSHMRLTKQTETNSDGSKRVTSYKYAHEEETGMETENMLSQVYWTKVENGSGNLLRKNWTEWSDNNTPGTWLPSAQWVWDGESNDPDDPMVSNADKTFTFNTYDGFGNVTKSTNARETATSLQWGHEATVPHAIIENAEASEVLTDGFESDLNSADWYISSSTAWTVNHGKLSYEGALTTWGWVGSNKVLTSDFTAEYDIRVKDASSNGDWGGFQFRKNGASDTFGQSGYLVYITFTGNLVLYRGGSSPQTLANYIIGESATLPHRFRIEAEGTNIRVYVDGVLRIDVTDNTFSGSYVGFTSFNSNTEFDNLRVYPLEASVTSASYDPATLQLDALIDPTGVVTSFEYDTHGRLAQSLNQGDMPLSNHVYSFSRIENNDTFDSSEPNFIQNTAIQSKPAINDWSVERTDGISQSTWWSLDTQKTTGTSSLDDTEAKVGVRSIKASVSTSERVLWDHWPSGGIPVDDSKLYHIGVWAKTSGSYSGDAYYKLFFRDASNAKLNTHDAKITIPEGDRDWTLYSKTVRPPAGAVKVNAIYLDLPTSSNGTIWWDATQFQEAPTTAFTFNDGLGRSVQTQAIRDDSTAVLVTEFGDLGRPEKGWAPYLISDIGVYDDDFSGPGGSAKAYFDGYPNLDDTANNFFAQTEYLNDPLARPDIVHPVAIQDTSNSVRHDYGTEQINSVWYSFAEVEDEDERKTRSYVDAFGNRVRTEAAVGTSIETVTKFAFDELSQLTKVTSPQGFNTFYGYDHRGQLTSKTTPDADGDGDGTSSDENANYDGDFRYKYDLSGNLRFEQDPNLRDSGDDFIYYKYDDLNRLIEVGEYTGSTTFDNAVPGSHSCTDEHTWPCSNTTKKVEYTYEGSFLTQVDTWEGSSNDYVKFVYNALGQVRDMTVNLAGLGEKELSYTYDLPGKPVKVSYQDGESDAFYTWYGYDAEGQLAEVKTNTTDNEETATREAAYTYWPTGSIRQLMLGPAGTTAAVQTLDYDYNIRGSLLNINDPFSLSDGNSLGGDAFAEKLGYESLTDIGGMSGATTEARYNGNISWVTWQTEDNDFGGSHVGYAFKYDDLDRLTKADFGQYTGSWTNASRYDVGKDQTNGIEYKANGNLWKLDRNDQNGSGTLATYNYAQGSNRLSSITGSSIAGSFTYDYNGNMLTGSGITTNIDYDYRNLPVGIKTYTFRYDADGNRIYSSIGNGSYYVRGAGGEVVAVYDGSGTLVYHNLLAGGRVIGKKLP